jgi:hypothetical protein
MQRHSALQAARILPARLMGLPARGRTRRGEHRILSIPCPPQPPRLAASVGLHTLRLTRCRDPCRRQAQLPKAPSRWSARWRLSPCSLRPLLSRDWPGYREPVASGPSQAGGRPPLSDPARLRRLLPVATPRARPGRLRMNCRRPSWDFHEVSLPQPATPGSRAGP